MLISSYVVQGIGKELAEAPVETLEDKNIKELIETGSKKSLILIHKKMDIAMKSKKELDKMNIAALNTVVGTLFDKRQISKGEATEHIALKAKISKDLSADEKMELIIQWREKNANKEE